MFPRACPGRFKSGSDPVQMHPGSNQMQLTVVPYVCLSSFASKSGCSGLLVHLRHLGHSARTPLPLFPRLGDLSVIILMRRSMVSHRLVSHRQIRHDEQYDGQSHRQNRVVSHRQNREFSSMSCDCPSYSMHLIKKAELDSKREKQDITECNDFCNFEQ